MRAWPIISARTRRRAVHSRAMPAETALLGLKFVTLLLSYAGRAILARVLPRMQPAYTGEGEIPGGCDAIWYE